MRYNRMLDLYFTRDTIQRPEEVRCSGRSTALAFQYLCFVIQYPGTERVIVDHHDAPDADKHLADRIREIIEKLELNFFVIERDRAGRYILRCDIYTGK